jgi:hypothetical protein
MNLHIFGSIWGFLNIRRTGWIPKSETIIYDELGQWRRVFFFPVLNLHGGGLHMNHQWLPYKAMNQATDWPTKHLWSW